MRGPLRLVEEAWMAGSRQVTCRSIERALRPDPKVLASRATGAVPGRLLYLAASVLPYHTSGYTARTHELIRALEVAGGDVRVVSRPGYPWDRKDRLREALGAETTVDGVRYRHLRAPRNNRPVLFYARAAATVIAEEARRQRVAAIHAASNHVNALPALLAARRLGLPFQYEMRGLWELTRISRMPDFEGTQAFHQGLELERLVAREADRVFVISAQLADYVASRWSVPRGRLALLPNCVDPARFPVGGAGGSETLTIGHAGSLMVYEGLDVLIDAVAQLRDAGEAVRVEIAGEGEYRPRLEAQVAALGLGDRVRFHGRLSPRAAREVVARSDVVCLPRRPFEVCRIVPPIKLVEALAMGRPVIVPDLPVFRDELGEAPPGWFFRAGDPEDLARCITEIIAAPAARAALGGQARAHVEAQRTWAHHVGKVLDLAGPAGAITAAGQHADRKPRVHATTEP